MGLGVAIVRLLARFCGRCIGSRPTRTTWGRDRTNSKVEDGASLNVLGESEEKRDLGLGIKIFGNLAQSCTGCMGFAPQGRRGAEIGPGPDSTAQKAKCGIGVPAPPLLALTPKALGFYTSGGWRGLAQPQGRPNSTPRAAARTAEAPTSACSRSNSSSWVGCY